jgi:hypothetical protein
MFVAEELAIGIECPAAQARFENLLHGGWLAEMSEASCDEGITGLLRVGPAGSVPGKLIRVSLLDPVYRDDAMTVGLRWEAAGTAGALFPVLDANLSISPAGEHTARLALAGSYRPPLGRLGDGLDRAIMHRIAAATMRALLRGVAEALVSPAPARDSVAGTNARLRPAPELETP